MKENMKIILNAKKYKDFKWQVCGDLKIVAIILGLQDRYTKFYCFLCLWDSRASKQYFTRRE